jgi:hypothetical protein
MALIADILLLAGTLAAALYCFVLSRRLTKFTDLEKGVGGAVAVLSAQVDDMTKAVEAARVLASGSAAALEATTARAEAVQKRLEILLAALHDLPDEPEPEPVREKRAVWRRPREAPPQETAAALPTFARAFQTRPLEAAE